MPVPRPEFRQKQNRGACFASASRSQPHGPTPWTRSQRVASSSLDFRNSLRKRSPRPWSRATAATRHNRGGATAFRVADPSFARCLRLPSSRFFAPLSAQLGCKGGEFALLRCCPYQWRRWESNPRPRSRESGVYECSRRSDLIPHSPRRRGCGGPARWLIPRFGAGGPPRVSLLSDPGDPRRRLRGPRPHRPSVC